MLCLLEFSLLQRETKLQSVWPRPDLLERQRPLPQVPRRGVPLCALPPPSSTWTLMVAFCLLQCSALLALSFLSFQTSSPTLSFPTPTTSRFTDGCMDGWIDRWTDKLIITPGSTLPITALPLSFLYSPASQNVYSLFPTYKSICTSF